MKKKLAFFISLILLLFACAFTKQKEKESSIFGNWKFVGTTQFSMVNSRIQSFNKDHSFETVSMSSDGREYILNHGTFYVLNDSTIVTYHTGSDGELIDLANTYHFRIKDERMHFYGFYLSQNSNNLNSIVKVRIDEIWEKVKK